MSSGSPAIRLFITPYSCCKQRNHHSSSLLSFCEGNSLTGWFPSQGNGGMLSMKWSLHNMTLHKRLSERINTIFLKIRYSKHSIFHCQMHKLSGPHPLTEIDWTNIERKASIHLPLDKMAAILAEDIFKCIFFNENNRIPIQISMRFVLGGPIDNKAALVKVMACHRTGDKPLSQPILARFTDAYMRH